MNNGASYTEFSNFSAEASSNGATFAAEVFEKIRVGAIAEADRLNAVADAFAKDFQKYSDTAQKYADRAAQAGETKAKDLFEKIATEFGKAATEKSYMDSKTYVEKISQDAKAASSGLASKVGPLADAVNIGIGAIDAATTGNTSSLGQASASTLGGGIGAALGTAAVGVLVAAGVLASAAGLVAGIIVGAAAVATGIAGQAIWDWFDPNKVKAPADAAKATLAPRYDPLTLDLDNDGLETTGVAATNPILFDHDGDGIKNGTGWVNADDGFLVRDVNGNGSIDSGRELFGDSTIKSNGQTAVDGFDALADLDSNADGKISSLDAQFTNLRLWRDLNQDGISQTGELFTLASLNIASINVTKTANSQTLANGNQIADLGTFTRADGTTGSTGAVTGNLADINLASDTFHRSFPNMLDTTSVATLPDMQGSGAVRDLREAANDAAEWRVLA